MESQQLHQNPHSHQTSYAENDNTSGTYTPLNEGQLIISQ